MKVAPEWRRSDGATPSFIISPREWAVISCYSRHFLSTWILERRELAVEAQIGSMLVGGIWLCILIK